MWIPLVVVTLNSKVIERRKLDKEETTIGRTQENDIVIKNLAVSRHHAKIYAKDGKVVIKDLGSANGTFVNGARAEEVELSTGDVILIGKYVLKLYNEEALRPIEDSAPQGDGGTVMVDAITREQFLERLKSELTSQTPKLISSEGKEIKISNEFFTIGKGYKSKLKIDGMFIKNPHAKIFKQPDGAYRIISMGSFFRPTKVNGSPVKEKILKDGDVIKIGKHEMIFTL
ncbi:MAG: FHA domain-containing protein [Ignavibacteriales bacterium]